MNKSIKKALPVFLVMSLCILAPFILVNLGEVTVKPVPTPSQLEAQLVSDLTEEINRYKKGEISEIDMSSLTTFTWDRLYVFGPYTHLAEIDSMFGNPWFGDSWRDKCHTAIELHDGVALLVFVSENKMVVCTDYPRVGRNDVTDYDVHDFAGLQEYKSGFLREEARFVLDERGRAIWAGNK
jgi:hypothetical protein